MSKSGGRIAKKVTKQELKEKILKEIILNGEISPYYLFQKLEKDLKKINFNFENYTMCGEYFDCDDKNPEEWGINTLDNGLTYCMCSAGGDWEHPVSFIIYIDNKNKLRAYIPSDGNVYNKKYKCAYGSESDCENYEDDFDDFDVDDVEPVNMELFIKDIENRITVC